MANIFSDFDLDIQIVRSNSRLDGVCTHEDTTCIYCGGEPTGTCVNTWECLCGTIAPCVTFVRKEKQGENTAK